MNQPSFQISVTINPNGEVAVLIGRDTPTNQATFSLPSSLDKAATHTLSVEFAAWRIVSAHLDDVALAIRADERSH